MLRYLGNVIVNGHEDVKYVDESKSLKSAVVPEFDNSGEYPRGTKQLLTELGPEKFAQWLKGEEKIHFSDTTFRDAHQYRLATWRRTVGIDRKSTRLNC